MNPADKSSETPTLQTALHGHQTDDANRELHIYPMDDIVTLFQTNVGVATGEVNGLMHSTDKVKLDTVYATHSSRGEKLTALQTSVFPLFIAAPANSVSELMFNLTNNAYEVEKARVKTASGTIDVTITIDGTPITGMDSVYVTSTGATLTASNASDRVIGTNSTLGLTLENNDTATNLMITLQLKNKTAADA